jgi:hypothetical protein
MPPQHKDFTSRPLSSVDNPVDRAQATAHTLPQSVGGTIAAELLLLTARASAVYPGCLVDALRPTQPLSVFTAHTWSQSVLTLHPSQGVGGAVGLR